MPAAAAQHPVPRILAISPPDPLAAEAWVRAAPELVEAGAQGLLLRVLGTPAATLPRWVDALLGTGAAVILHARCPGAVQLAAQHGLSLHLPSWEDPQPWRPRVAGLLGQSCHDLAQLQRAALCCDYATLSPIFPPLSKPQDARPALGVQRLAAAARAVRLPILALGGLTPAGVEACLRAGAWGAAGIGSFARPDQLSALAKALEACEVSPQPPDPR